jgi:hypothetical protein
MYNYLETYRMAFAKPQYNGPSVSYENAKKFIDVLSPNSVLNVGSGRGNLERLLQEETFSLSSCDLENFLDQGINTNFFKVDLSKLEDLEKLPQCEVLTCLDVLEHIEEVYIDSILKRFSEVSDNCYFTIANHSDIMNGVQLHLIQKPCEFWTPVLEKYFKVDSLEHYYSNRLMAYSLTSR